MSKDSHLVRVGDLRPGDFFSTPGTETIWCVLHPVPAGFNIVCVSCDEDTPWWSVGEEVTLSTKNGDRAGDFVPKVNPLQVVMAGLWPERNK